MRTFALVLALLAVPAAVGHCQDRPPAFQVPPDTVYVTEYNPLAGAIATTGCLGGKIYQAIDMAVIGDSIWTEVVAHEAVHKRQYEGWLESHNKACPQTSPLFILAWEIEAYCEVRHIRLERGWDLAVVNAEYIDRMQNQFKGQLPKEHVAVLYTLGCP